MSVATDFPLLLLWWLQLSRLVYLLNEIDARRMERTVQKRRTHKVKTDELVSVCRVRV